MPTDPDTAPPPSLPTSAPLPNPPLSPLLTSAERHAAGKRRRQAVPRDSHAAWSPGPERPDPIDLLVASGQHRVQRLLPVRYARMAASPFAFLRGAAAVMAADLHATPTSGIRVQACGDCHLSNFGVYASPEGVPVFDINDFDETLVAPFEWDVKRLATSIVLAGREAGLGDKAARKAARTCVHVYRTYVRGLAQMDPLLAWHNRVDVRKALKGVDDAPFRARELRRIAGSGAGNPALYDFPKLVDQQGSTPRIKDNPPLIFHFDVRRDGEHSLRARDVFAVYRETLPDERRLLYDQYRLVDAAFKVVGVGSVGTFCAIGLFMTADGAPLFLQIKEAQASVLAPYAGASPYANQGQRVVVGQRIMQAVSDVFLGWTHDKSDRNFYVRQLKDRKLAAVGAALEQQSLSFYARLCGETLARAHARSGAAAAIAGYLGSSDAFESAIEEFAVAYAAQSTRDHQRLLDAIQTGRLPAGLTIPGPA